MSNRRVQVSALYPVVVLPLFHPRATPSPFLRSLSHTPPLNCPQSNQRNNRRNSRRNSQRNKRRNNQANRRRQCKSWWRAARSPAATTGTSSSCASCCASARRAGPLCWCWCEQAVVLSCSADRSCRRARSTRSPSPPPPSSPPPSGRRFEVLGSPPCWFPRSTTCWPSPASHRLPTKPP